MFSDHFVHSPFLFLFYQTPYLSAGSWLLWIVDTTKSGVFREWIRCRHIRLFPNLLRQGFQRFSN